MTVKKRLWINHCVAEICSGSSSPNSPKPSGLEIIIHGSTSPKQYQQIKEYLWTEEIMEEVLKSELGLILPHNVAS